MANYSLPITTMTTGTTATATTTDTCSNITWEICDTAMFNTPKPVWKQNFHYQIKCGMQLLINSIGIFGNLLVLYAIMPKIFEKFRIKKRAKNSDFSREDESKSHKKSGFCTKTDRPKSPGDLLVRQIHSPPSPQFNNRPYNLMSPIKELNSNASSPIQIQSSPEIQNLEIKEVETTENSSCWTKFVKAHRKHKIQVRDHFESILSQNACLQTICVGRMKLTKIMVNLCVADILFSLIHFSDAIWIVTLQWYAGNIFCKFYQWFRLSFIYSSSLIVSVISIDRCLSIVYPMQIIQNEKITINMLIFAWITALLAGLPQFLIFSQQTLQGIPCCQKFDIEINDFTQCVDLTVAGPYADPKNAMFQWLNNFYYPMTMVIQFVIPLIATLISYLMIIYEITAMKHKKKRDSTTQNNFGNRSLKNSKNQSMTSSFFGSVKNSVFSKRTTTSQDGNEEFLPDRSRSLPKKRTSMDQARINTVQIAFYAATSFIITAGPYYTSYFIQKNIEEAVHRHSDEELGQNQNFSNASNFSATPSPTSIPVELDQEHHNRYSTEMEYIHTTLLLFFQLNPICHVLIYGFLMKEVRQTWLTLWTKIKSSIFLNCIVFTEFYYYFFILNSKEKQAEANTDSDNNQKDEQKPILMTRPKINRADTENTMVEISPTRYSDYSKK